MTIKITDRTTGESYEAKTVKDCRDWADSIGYRQAEAYGKTVIILDTVYEIVSD
jgi:hypothetical protein